MTGKLEYRIMGGILAILLGALLVIVGMGIAGLVPWLDHIIAQIFGEAHTAVVAAGLIGMVVLFVIGFVVGGESDE